jgi:hypothetical protein
MAGLTSAFRFCSFGGRGGGAARAVPEDELLHLQRRPHPQGGVPLRALPEQQESQPLRRQGECSNCSLRAEFRNNKKANLFALFSSDNERGLVSLDRADSYCSSRAGFRPVRPQAERGGRLRGVPAVAQHLPPQGARVGEGSVYVTPTSRRTTPCPFHTTTSRKLTCLT